MNAQLHISHLRLGLAALAASSAVAAGAAPAFAATRYAAPAPAGAQNCSSEANACSIVTAVGGANPGDQVIVEPGDYGSPSSPLTTTIETGAQNVDIHGTGKGPGAPRAVIYSSAPYGVSVDGFGSQLSDLDIEDSGNSNGAALAFSGALAQRLLVWSGPDEAWGCDINGSAVLRDSLCEQQGLGEAIGVSGVLYGPNEVGLRNDTAVSTSGIGIYVASAGPRWSTVKVINTIARGGHYDIEAFQAGASATVTTSHSNYGTTDTGGGGTITDDGTSQTSGVQSPAQLFVNPVAGDFHEAVGAQTIATGDTSSANGATDFYGDPRKALGHACQTTDIGADEFQPAATPTVAATGVSAVTRRGATVSGLANPLGGTEVVYFQYGQAGPHGGGPSHHATTTPVCFAPTDSSMPVKAKLDGLRAGTKYFYRVVASDAAGETRPVFTATFTTRGRVGSRSRHHR
jgi:hypothetical protein